MRPKTFIRNRTGLVTIKRILCIGQGRSASREDQCGWTPIRRHSAAAGDARGFRNIQLIGKLRRDLSCKPAELVTEHDGESTIDIYRRAYCRADAVGARGIQKVEYVS